MSGRGAESTDQRAMRHPRLRREVADRLARIGLDGGDGVIDHGVGRAQRAARLEERGEAIECVARRRSVAHRGDEVVDPCPGSAGVEDATGEVCGSGTRDHRQPRRHQLGPHVMDRRRRFDDEVLRLDARDERVRDQRGLTATIEEPVRRRQIDDQVHRRLRQDLLEPAQRGGLEHPQPRDDPLEPRAARDAPHRSLRHASAHGPRPDCPHVAPRRLGRCPPTAFISCATERFTTPAACSTGGSRATG